MQMLTAFAFAQVNLVAVAMAVAQDGRITTSYDPIFSDPSQPPPFSYSRLTASLNRLPVSETSATYFIHTHDPVLPIGPVMFITVTATGKEPATPTPQLQSRMNIDWKKIENDVLKGGHKAESSKVPPSAIVSRAEADTNTDKNPQAMVTPVPGLTPRQWQKDVQNALSEASKAVSAAKAEASKAASAGKAEASKAASAGKAEASKAASAGLAEAFKAASAAIAEASKAASDGKAGASKAASAAIAEASKAASVAIAEASEAEAKALLEAEKAMAEAISEAEKAKADVLEGGMLQRVHQEALAEAEEAKAKAMAKLREGTWWRRRRNVNSVPTTATVACVAATATPAMGGIGDAEKWRQDVEKALSIASSHIANDFAPSPSPATITTQPCVAVPTATTAARPAIHNEGAVFLALRSDAGEKAQVPTKVQALVAVLVAIAGTFAMF